MTPFKLSEEDQNILNQANLIFEIAQTRRQLIVTQILLKHKDKDLRFDVNTGLFMESGPEVEKNTIPIRPEENRA